MATISTGSNGQVSISISISPSVASIDADFKELSAGIRSFREPLKRAIQGVVSPSFVRNFEVGGRPTWAPLSERRIAEKQALGYPLDTLIATGKLKQVAGQLNIWTIEGGYLTGEAQAYVAGLPGAEYGKYHTTGTRKMPARPFLLVQQDDADEIEITFMNYIAERLAKANFRVGV